MKRLMPEIQLDSRSSSLLRSVMAGGLAVVVAIATAALIGWAFGLERLTMLVPDAPRMAGNTALALLLISAALWLIRAPECSPRNHRLARGLAGLGALLGAMALIEYVGDLDLHVDDLFGHDETTLYPGHMSPHTAAALVCCGLWVTTMDLTGSRTARLCDVLAPLAGIAVLAALIGWLYGVDYIQGTGGEPGIAPQTVVALVCLFLAILASRPQSPWMRLVSGPGAGGHLMRRFVPLLMIGAILAGYLLIRGVETGLWGVSVGAAFVIAVLVSVLLGGLVQTSRQLELADVERRRLQESLVDLADRDPLTNVFNRRRFDEELRRQFALFERHGAPAAVLTIDLDDFKMINDTYGHAAGDELLLATAEVLAQQLRASDIVARFGGDEFMVLLPAIEPEAAGAVADKLVRGFREVKRTAPDGTQVNLRASIGVAHSAHGGWPRPEALLIAADKALYLAKHEGGDRFASDAELVVN
jgi:diguanylate cyclase (GGDEF)-like protein